MADDRQDPLADVFVEWSGLAATDIRSRPEIEAAGCFDLHRVQWKETFISEEEPRRICHFRAPDAESVRNAFRQGGVPFDAVWTGTVHHGEESVRASSIVEIALSPPLPADPAQALERVQEEWLIPRGFKLARAIVSSGGGRVICFCEAPVGDALRQLRMRGDSMWPCRRVTADRPYRR